VFDDNDKLQVAHLWDLEKFYIFTLSCKFLYKYLMMISLMETCSVWKNNNKYGLCQTEYVILFM
jgi:hypothetical protein